MPSPGGSRKLGSLLQLILFRIVCEPGLLHLVFHYGNSLRVADAIRSSRCDTRLARCAPAQPPDRQGAMLRESPSLLPRLLLRRSPTIGDVPSRTCSPHGRGRRHPGHVTITTAEKILWPPTTVTRRPLPAPENCATIRQTRRRAALTSCLRSRGVWSRGVRLRDRTKMRRPRPLPSARSLSPSPRRAQPRWSTESSSHHW